MNIAQLDAIVRKHTDFLNFDTLVGTYVEKQVRTAYWLPDAKSDADMAELNMLADALHELAVQVIPSLGIKPEKTEIDNPIPEKPFTARDAAEEIWRGSDEQESLEEAIARIVPIIEKVNAPHS